MMMFNCKFSSRSLAATGLLALCLGASQAQAQVSSFPQRPVSFVVPAAPGGVTDIAARFLGDRLSKMWGKQVVVENRSGGGGTIGVTAFVRSAPDGHTLLMTTNGELTLLPELNKSITFDRNKDFVPIAMVTSNPVLVVANASTPYKTMADLIAAAKANPGHITWSSPGAGTWNHMTGEWISQEAGIKLLHVPYRGGAPASTAVSAGEVQLSIIAVSSALPHLQSGRIRVLALASEERTRMDSSWKPLAEGTIPGFNSMQWVGMYAPAGIDPALREKITKDVMTALADPDLRKRFENAGVDVIGKDNAAAAKQLQADYEITSRVAKQANMKPAE